MTRSILSQSLFQESVSSAEDEGRDQRYKREVVVVVGGAGVGGGHISSSRSGMEKQSGGGGGATAGGGYGCGGRRGGGGGGGGGCGLRFDFLSRILDVFSLNGPCCNHCDNDRQHEVSGGGGGGGKGGICSEDDCDMTSVKKARSGICA